jgi:hypothetical protein
MSSAHLQILTLLAEQRIHVAAVERLLTLVAAPAAGSLAHFSHSLHTAVDSMLRTITASETFHCLRIFIRRFLGELP